MKIYVLVALILIIILLGTQMKTKIEVNASFLVRAQAEKVFANLVDFESILKWNSTMREVKSLSGK